eukprot:TRINITY_DN17294_c0_g2_i1.p2 TRINITY_DN17294_c0_g2~~TRINITY_DN17294_c0_g2_i1.p2  ORF type:complete len:128 (+),score=48.77 TRINITY_DN17294_c0_g2_i1:125-508(+)
MLRRAGSLLCRHAMAAPEDISVVWVTAPVDKVDTLAAGIINSRLAACVNIMPQVKSVYEWEGKVENEAEGLMMIKTRTDRIEDLKAWVSEHHPYDCPELISVKLQDGLPGYLSWVAKNAAPGQAPLA